MRIEDEQRKITNNIGRHWPDVIFFSMPTNEKSKDDFKHGLVHAVSYSVAFETFENAKFDERIEWHNDDRKADFVSSWERPLVPIHHSSPFLFTKRYWKLEKNSPRENDFQMIKNEIIITDRKILKRKSRILIIQEFNEG